jgi:hypothetical protein
MPLREFAMGLPQLPAHTQRRFGVGDAATVVFTHYRLQIYDRMMMEP